MALITNNKLNLRLLHKLNLANLIDWLVTFCLGGIIVLTTLKLGGVRPETQVALLPLYPALLILHGIWFVVNTDSPKRLSHVPLWFIPILVWIIVSAIWTTPFAWLGWYEVIYALQMFIVMWVFANNVRDRSHLWALIIMCLVPFIFAIYNGFYQFSQDSGRIVDAMAGFPLELNSKYIGQATGVFADPNTFAAFLLILLPTFLIAATVDRLPKIIRILCFYIFGICFWGVAITKVYWAGLLIALLISIVPWFCCKQIKTKIVSFVVGIFTSALVFWAMVMFYPDFSQDLENMSSKEGEGVRVVLREQAVSMAMENPVFGVGAGAYGISFQQSKHANMSDSPETPDNDYLLVLSQLGFVGVLLIVVPSLIVLIKAISTLRNQPFSMRLRESGKSVMPIRRFFLSLGISGFIAFGLCSAMTLVFYIPALTLYGLVMLLILIKLSFNRHLKLPSHWFFRTIYLCLAVFSGWAYFTFSAPKLKAHGLELTARQQLEHLVGMRIHASENTSLLDDVIISYEEALVADDQNVDAWIGLSSSICLEYLRDPARFVKTGPRAIDCARRATELSPAYWLSWSQLGVANSFNGNLDAAEHALLKAIQLAPNSSNAHYYYAAFLAADKDRALDAIKCVKKALEINPRNHVARRLEQKLVIP